MKVPLQQRVRQEFKTCYGDPPDIVVRAPGRVNLIGEHTDYNDGFVLPMAIDRALWIALRPRQDGHVRLHSLDFPTTSEFSLDGFQHTGDWTDYVRGMAWALQETGQRLQGWDGLLASDIPVASGLSSSAAIELATARAFWALSHWGWDGIEMARTARKMENEWLGLRSGIMDQMISACGRENHALLIDCRDLTSEPVPHPEGLTIVVMDTAVRRGLVDSAYNQRVEQCRAAAKHLGIISLREASSELLAARSLGLDEILLRRARHVVSENERTLQAAAAMRDGKTTTLGRLMDASHNSLRDDYEVSCPELDSMVEIARSQEGCLGARMTGAGFGGCAVALVQSANVDEFCGRVHKGYRRTTGRIPNIFACQPSAGAALVSEREP